MADAMFDEMTGAGGDTRRQYALIRRWLDETPREVLARKRDEAEFLFRRITEEDAYFRTLRERWPAALPTGRFRSRPGPRARPTAPRPPPG